MNRFEKKFINLSGDNDLSLVKTNKTMPPIPTSLESIVSIHPQNALTDGTLESGQLSQVLNHREYFACTFKNNTSFVLCFCSNRAFSLC